MNPHPSNQSRSTFSWSELIPNILAGLVVGLIVVIVSISLATLIFSGPLETELPKGIGLILFSGIVITGLISLLSSYSGMIAYPQERVAPILAGIAVVLVESMQGTSTPAEMFNTVVAAIAFTSLVNGLALWALGTFQLGTLIRFIPYPVIGGFLAGTGWLLVRGSAGVMTGLHINLEGLPELAEWTHLSRLLAGLGYGLLLVAVSRRTHHFLVMPGLLLGGVALFYGILAASGFSSDSARDAGWLLGPFPESDGWTYLTGIIAFREADWPLILEQAGSIGTIVLISVISVLLNSGAIELAARRDIHLDHELRSAGWANLLVGLGGGTVGFHSLSISRLVLSMGARSRLVGVVASLLCAVMLVLGTTAISLFPRVILGGLLFYLGMHFLIEWLYDAWFRMTRADYAIVVLILACVAAFGYLPGVGVGIFACIILFLINYSQVDVIKHALTGQQRHSNVDRPARHIQILEESGEAFLILPLQGFIFFGTANGLLERVKMWVGSEAGTHLQFALLDFGDVSGIDSSSLLSFVKMKQLAEQNGFVLIFTQLSEVIALQIEKEGLLEEPGGAFRTFLDLDHGLEFCEDEFLSRAGISQTEYDSISVEDQLREVLPETVDIERLIEFFEALDVGAGHVLIEQGSPASDLFLVARGQVTVQVDNGLGNSIRLRKICSGTIVGELGMILDQPRSASVVAEVPCRVYRLSREALLSMRREAPELALAFEGYLTHLLAERLSHSTHTIEALLD
jgi:SulP family sulfate permease